MAESHVPTTDPVPADRDAPTNAAGNIFKAICQASAAVAAVGKTEKNESQGFMFRSIEAVMNAVHGIFAEHKIFTTKRILERKAGRLEKSDGKFVFTTSLHVRFRFYCDDGSFVETEASGVGFDSYDKGDNKAMAVALKYALFELLMIPYGQEDPDGSGPDDGNGSARGSGAKASVGGSGKSEPSEGMRKAIYAIFGKEARAAGISTSEYQKHALHEFLSESFDVTSTTELTYAQGKDLLDEWKKSEAGTARLVVWLGKWTKRNLPQQAEDDVPF